MNIKSSTRYTCRTCLKSVKRTRPLFQAGSGSELSPAAIISNYGIDIENDAALPDVVCTSCFNSINFVYTFLEGLKKNQEAFLNQNNVIIEEIGTVEDEELKSDMNDYYVIDDNQIIANVKNDDGTFVEYAQAEDIVIQEDSGTSWVEAVNNGNTTYKVRKVDGSGFKLIKNKNKDSGTGESVNTAIKDTKPNQLKEHIKHECPSCDRSFKVFVNFSKHILSHKEIIACKFCSEKLLPCDYGEHYTKNHRYTCKVCSESFSGYYPYYEHLKSHEAITVAKYPCTFEGCEKSFMAKQSLSHHMAVHSDVAMYECALCSMSFKNYDALRYHNKKHTGRPHLCMYCGKSFIQSIHLTHHIWRHTGNKPYKCKSCGKGFVGSKSLKLHVFDCGVKMKKLGQVNADVVRVEEV